MAALRFHEFRTQAPEADDRYEWSEFFLARSFKALGYLHASAEYDFNVVKHRRVPRLLPESLGELEALSRTKPYDRVLVEEVLIEDIEFPEHLPERLNDFVHYVQGYWNLRRDVEKWAKASFGRIRGDGLYRMKAELYTAYWLIRRDRLAEALPLFEGLKDHVPQRPIDPIAEEVVRDEARETLARLAFEAGDWEGAWALYDSIVDPLRTRHHLPLEKAWTLYYQRAWPRTLGLLYALDSPRFRDAFLPDRYILRGIVYTSLCHFRAAQEAVDAFRRRFEPSLVAIRARGDLTQDPSMRHAAVSTPRAARIDRFLRSVVSERSRADAEDAWRGSDLSAHLAELYGLQEREVRRLWADAVAVAFKEHSAKLLEYEEQINLLDYEVGIALYRRIKDEERREEAADADFVEVPIGERPVVVRPHGEYWNDELHDYTVLIADRCEAQAAAK